jgi:DNA-binding CsgD family transcriptional regulator
MCTQVDEQGDGMVAVSTSASCARSSGMRLKAVAPPAAPLESHATHEVLDLWTQLLDGRWVVIDRRETETDGTFVLERQPRGASTLSPRERQVVDLMVQGQSLKYVGLELTLSTSTVATLLRRAMRKLGVESRLELVRLFAVASRARCAG